MHSYIKKAGIYKKCDLFKSEVCFKVSDKIDVPKAHQKLIIKCFLCNNNNPLEPLRFIVCGLSSVDIFPILYPVEKIEGVEMRKIILIDPIIIQEYSYWKVERMNDNPIIIGELYEYKTID